MGAHTNSHQPAHSGMAYKDVRDVISWICMYTGTLSLFLSVLKSFIQLLLAVPAPTGVNQHPFRLRLVVALFIGGGRWVGSSLGPPSLQIPVHGARRLAAVASL